MFTGATGTAEIAKGLHAGKRELKELRGEGREARIEKEPRERREENRVFKTQKSEEECFKKGVIIESIKQC